MLYLVAKNSKFSADKWRFDKRPIPTILCIFVDLLQIHGNFHCQESIRLHMGCPLARERKQKKSPVFNFKSARVRLRESVPLRERVNTEFDREASVSRAVRLPECPLAGS